MSTSEQSEPRRLDSVDLRVRSLVMAGVARAYGPVGVHDDYDDEPEKEDR